MCRFESKRFDSRLRKSISEALTGIRGKTITFTRSDSEGLQKVSVTGLLKTGELDFANDQWNLKLISDYGNSTKLITLFCYDINR